MVFVSSALNRSCQASCHGPLRVSVRRIHAFLKRVLRAVRQACDSLSGRFARLNADRSYAVLKLGCPVCPAECGVYVSVSLQDLQREREFLIRVRVVAAHGLL